MRITDYMNYTCSTVGCNNKAVIELTLENYHVTYSCAIHERALIRRYRVASIMRLDEKAKQ